MSGSPPPASHPGEALLDRVVEFAHRLRGAGVSVRAGASIDALRSLAVVNPADPEQFRCALQANLVSDPGELTLFHVLYQQFWLPVDRMESSRLDLATDLDTLELQQPDPACAGEPAPAAAEGADGGEPDGEQVHDPETGSGLERLEREEDGEPGTTTSTATSSPSERLVRKDFAALDPEELRRMHRLVDQLEAAPPTALTRRYRTGGLGSQMDFRATWRHALPRGEALELRWRARQRQRRRLVLLCDVSHSMEGYSRTLLHFAYVLTRRLPDTEVFTFSTRLNRVTGRLRDRDPAGVLAALADEGLAWSSGTSIGACLAEFNRVWATTVLDSGTVVAVLSDGWECGDTAVLGEAMGALRRRCRTTFWLTPAMSDPRYSPETTGMRTVLRHVDVLLPCHNLASLRDFVRFLGAR